MTSLQTCVTKAASVFVDIIFDQSSSLTGELSPQPPSQAAFGHFKIFGLHEGAAGNKQFEILNWIHTALLFQMQRYEVQVGNP